MHPIVKVLFGAILLVGGIAVTYQFTLNDFYAVVKGIVPPFVALLGLFIMWLELDELRIEKEMKSSKKRK